MQQKPVRAFWGIEPPAALRKTLNTECERLKSPLKRYNLRWIRESSWHITLQFLGNVPLAQCHELVAEVQSIPLPAAFDLPFEVIDWFPSARRPAVLAAIPAPCENLNQLARQIQRCALGLGIATRSQPFHSHLTLARLRSRRRNVSDAQLLPQALNVPAMHVSRAYLYQSQTLPEGAVYSKLACLTLPQQP